MGVLMVCSLAPPTALLTEWLWLGTTLSVGQLGCMAAVLVSVGLAVAPRERQHLKAADVRAGILFGVQAAVAQGLGAAVSRVAFDRLGDPEVSFWLPTLYRVAAGALGVWIWITLRQLAGKKPLQKPAELIPHKRIGGHPLVWMGVSTVMGPVIGMMFLMRAFESAPSGLVQATLSTLPVFMIPVAWVFDGSRPSLQSGVAGIAAVGFTVLLVLL
jgi:drug/metabolite transporter (DMT)-like permease